LSTVPLTVLRMLPNTCSCNKDHSP
jgi:hypothetical protein